MFEIFINGQEKIDKVSKKLCMSILLDEREKRRSSSASEKKGFIPETRIVETEDVTFLNEYKQELNLGKEETLKFAIKEYARIGFSFMNEKSYDKAIDVFGSAITLNSSNAALYAVRASAYSAKKQIDTALQDINRAIMYDPKEPHYYIFRGDLLIKNREIDKGLHDYKKALTLRPMDQSLGNIIGDTLFESYLYSEAIYFYEHSGVNGNKEALKKAKYLLDKCTFQSMMSSNTLESMRSAVLIYPHLRSNAYIIAQSKHLSEKKTRSEIETLTLE